MGLESFSSHHQGVASDPLRGPRGASQAWPSPTQGEMELGMGEGLGAPWWGKKEQKEGTGNVTPLPPAAGPQARPSTSELQFTQLENGVMGVCVE
jgi:hypothetical protein